MATKVSDPKDATASRRAPFLVELYQSALGKKYVMAITGIVGLGYVLAHMVGNLKLYTSPEEFNHYAEWLRAGLLVPIVPEEIALNLMRVVLLVALVLHVVAAAQLTGMNRRARPETYHAKREFVAADFAARTMRWTGVIVLAFIIYHLADFTWGWVNPASDGTPYEKVVASFQVPVVAAFYVIANALLGVHLYHGVWSLFQSMGWNNRRFNHWRRSLAVGLTAIVVIGNLSFPIAVQVGLIS